MPDVREGDGRVVYQGNVTVIKHGSEGLAQVRYRLAGISEEVTERGVEPITSPTVAYRLGNQGDSRRVVYAGRGKTAELLMYRPGEQLTAADQRIVERVMAGKNPETGALETTLKVRIAGHARVPAAPIYDVISRRLRLAGIEPHQVFRGASKNSSGHLWTSLERRLAVKGARLTVSTADVTRLVARAATVVAADGQPIISLADVADVLPEGEWSKAVAASQARGISGNAGYDMTFTAPKSFSIAFIAAPAERQSEYMRAVEDATRNALDALMDRVGLVGLGHRGDGQKQAIHRADGYAATITVETYSRAEDPHLHAHTMIANRLALLRDGEWIQRAFLDGGRSLIAHSPWFQAEAMRQLRAISTERGLVTRWDLDPLTDVWECNGIDQRTRGVFSRMQRLMTSGRTADLGPDRAGPNVAARAWNRILRGFPEHPDVKRIVVGSGAGALRKPSKGANTLTLSELTLASQQHANEHHIDLGAINRDPNLPAGSQPSEWSDDQFADAVERALCEYTAITSTVKVEAQIRAWAPLDWTDSRIADMKRRIIETRFLPTIATTIDADDPDVETTARGVRPFGSVDSAIYASRRVYAAESSVANTIAATSGVSTKALTSDAALTSLNEYLNLVRQRDPGFRDFTEGQKALYLHICQTPDLIHAVIGHAGTGKTTAIDAARFALGRAGQTIFGISTAALAARTLGQEGGFAASSVAKLLQQIAFERAPDTARFGPTQRRKSEIMREIHLGQASNSRQRKITAQRLRETWLPPSMDRLIVDEASMLGAEHAATLIEWAAERDVAITLMGDPMQLGAIDASGLFAQIAKITGAPELTENMRQKTDMGRQVAAFVREGQIQEAIELLQSVGNFVAVRTEAEKLELLLSFWQEQCRDAADGFSRQDTVLEAARNDQVAVLNQAAARIAEGAGWTRGEPLTIDDGWAERTYRVGEQVIITENLRKRTDETPPGTERVILNGTRAIVTDIDHARHAITITWQEKKDGIQVPRTATLTGSQIVKHSDLGYALTGHKTQGQTVDEIASDIGDRDASAAYVMFTRARYDTLAVVNIGDLVDGAEYHAIADLPDDQLQDWAVEKVAALITERGRDSDITAHEAVGRELFTSVSPAVAQRWTSRRFGHLSDDELAELARAADASLARAVAAETLVRAGMPDYQRQSEAAERTMRHARHATTDRSADADGIGL